MENILLVEDDENLSLGIKHALKKEGFNVEVAYCLNEGRNLFSRETYDLVLLDVRLPDGSGFDLCQHIRGVSDVPIIFLTACDEEVNVVLGFDMGADDYVTKPFRLKELVSRIKANIKRSKSNRGSQRWISKDILLNLSEMKLYKKGIEIYLTPIEYKLIYVFINNPLKVISREILLQNIWDIDEEFIDDNTLSVHIRRLREKIEDDPSRPDYIVTARGIGYKWNQRSSEI